MLDIYSVILLPTLLQKARANQQDELYETFGAA